MRRNVLRSPVTLGVLAGLILLVGGVSLHRGLNHLFDFKHFYLDARYVWKYGELNPVLSDPSPDLQRQLPFYLPVVPLTLAPLAAGGLKPAAITWAILQMLAVLYCGIAIARRFTGGRQPNERAAAFLIAALLMLPAVFEAAKFNQLSFFVLALVLAGVGALDRRHSLRAGWWFGLAAILKLLPALFLVWLLLKRQWLAAAVMVVTMIVVAVVPVWLTWGGEGLAQYHGQWWRHNVDGVLGRGMVDEGRREHFVDHRNQSIPAVVGRWTRADHPYPLPWQPLQFSNSTAKAVAITLAGLLAVGLIVFTARAAHALPRGRLRTEAAVYLIALLVFSPLLRQYYLVWAFPAIALATAWMIGGATRPVRRYAALTVVVWAVGQLAWLSPTLRLGGVHLLMLIAVSVLLLLAAQSDQAKRTIE